MKTLAAAAIRCSLIFLLPTVAYSISAQWDLDPISGDWNSAANWTPMGVPNGPADVATFGLSNTTDVSISANTEVNAITFTSAATNPYTITASPGLTLTISGTGITNNSGTTQEFMTGVDGAGNRGQIVFTNSATAGTSVIFINNGSAADFVGGGQTIFHDSSTAANGTFVNMGAAGSRSGGGITAFYDSSTAGNANFTNKDGIGTSTSATIFHNTSTAANGFFTNDGGATPGGTFAEGGQTIFHDTSTAANGTFTNNGATITGGFGGATVFDGSSIAGNGIFINNGGAASGVAALGGGNTIFFNVSNAANGTFTNNAATESNGEGGVTEFGTAFSSDNAPSAGNGTFINNGATISDAVGGKTAFYENSTVDAATLIANGGTNGGRGGAIFFEGQSTGGTSRVELFGNGSLDISGHNAPGVTIGSIEGDGAAFLGANNLTVGSNNLSTTFSGVIQDGGGFNSTGGSITKIGTGTLTLSGQNTYTGSTTVNQGTLIVNGSINSATTVHGGTIGGSGTVRDVTVNSGGTLAPGNSPGILTVQGNLVLNLGANYLVDLNGTVVGSEYDQTNVSGTVTVAGATLALSLGFTPPTGTVFVIIRNGSNNPVNGTFTDLPEGAVFTADGQAFMISYQAGDGNDVALTSVVPEPRSWTLVTFGAIMLVIWHRRRAACTSNHFRLARESRE